MAFFHIIANFPSNRDYKGSLKMYNSSGKLVFGPVDALGRGTSSKENNNNHANWWLTYADTPTGTYSAKVTNPGSPESSFGPHKRVSMDPTSGNALIAKQNGRYGFMIHGGDAETNSNLPWYPLEPTLGCIRLSNSDQKKLIDTIETNDGTTGQVTVNNI